MSEVVVTIKPDGTSTVDAEGIVGSVCTLQTKPYTDALGKVTKSTPKAEMFQEQTLAQEVRS